MSFWLFEPEQAASEIIVAPTAPVESVVLYSTNDGSTHVTICTALTKQTPFCAHIIPNAVDNFATDNVALINIPDDLSTSQHAKNGLRYQSALPMQAMFKKCVDAILQR